MKIHVLGPGCSRCGKLLAEVEQAVAEVGVEAQLCKVESLEQIVRFGVAFTPGLVIDGLVVSQGKLPTRDQIVKWITDAADRVR